jgi:hypothetical protein
VEEGEAAKKTTPMSHLQNGDTDPTLFVFCYNQVGLFQLGKWSTLLEKWKKIKILKFDGATMLKRKKKSILH